MIQRLIFLTLSFFIAAQATGQTETDVIRYSRYFVGGTARTMAVGGAFGALGADFAVTSINPAGVGVYRSSEFSITPGYQFQTTEAQSGGTSEKNAFNRFNFHNAGLVFANTSKTEEGSLKSLNFAVGFNKLAVFKDNYFTSETSDRSILERFLLFANSGSAGLFSTQLALDTDLIFPSDPMTSECPCSIDISQEDMVRKDLEFQSKGSIDEIVLSVAGNYNHKLFFGATLGIPIVNYKQETIYSEFDDNDQIPFFNSLVFNEEFSTTGAGANLKLGAIYRVNKKIRAGLAVHTPTVYTMSDDFSSSMESSITYAQGDPATSSEANSPLGAYEYDIKTPWKVIASGVLILKKIGFVSIEAEWLNYANAKLKVDLDVNPGDITLQEGVNADVKATYGNAINLRAGIEHTIKLFRIRGGYGFYGQPYKSGVNEINANLHRISGGFGFREKKFAVDIAFVQEISKDLFTNYSIPGTTYSHTASLSAAKSHILASLSFKF